MGKYMRKAKVSGGVVVAAAAVIEGPQKAFLGVRTRARALALQRLPPTPPLSQQTPREDPYAYLQLRSRRLERNFGAKAKPSAVVAAAASPNRSPSNVEVDDGKPEESSGKSSSQDSVSVSSCFFSNGEKREGLPEVDGGNRVGASVSTTSPEFIAGVEASFGENVPEPESSRSVRETTPCSQIQDSETLDTPGSTTRPMVATSSKNKPQKIIPDCNLFDAEMHEFFSLKEQTQQRMFQIKYNYDIMNDRPLPGRYEWTKLDA